MIVNGIKPGTTGDQVFNKVRATLSEGFKNNVPIATPDNIRDIYTSLTNYTPGQNEFLEGLFNVIGKQIVTFRMWTNPLAKYQYELALGDTVEEVFTDIVNSVDLDPKEENNPFKKTLPDTKSVFYNKPLYKTWYTTVNQQWMVRAFMSWEGLMNLVNLIVLNLMKSYNIEDFGNYKALMQVACDNKAGKFVQVPRVVDAASARELLRAIRSESTKLTIPSRDYNYMKVMTHVPLEEQILLVTPEVDAYLDVDVLAYTFHMDKADVQQFKEIVDVLPFDMQAMLVTKSWFKVFIRQGMPKITLMFNPADLLTNFYLHVEKIYAAGAFEPVVFFGYAAGVSKFQIQPETQTVVGTTGGSLNFTTTIEYTSGYVFKDCVPVYSIKETKLGVTVDAESGIVTFTPGAASSGETYTVVATSSLDPGVTSEAIITVT